MKIDMSPHAVTTRLRQTSDLRRLCIALGGNRLKDNIRKDEQAGEEKETKIQS